MRIFLAGGVSGNLKPAWRRMANTTIDSEGFIRALVHENFYGRNKRTPMDTPDDPY